MDNREMWPPTPPTDPIFKNGDFVEIKETGARGFIIIPANGPSISKYCDEPYSKWSYRIGTRPIARPAQDSFWREDEITLAVMGYYTVEILKAELSGEPFKRKDPRNDRENTIYNVLLTFDKAVPNGMATMVVDLHDKKGISVAILPMRGPPEIAQILPNKLGSPVKSVHAQWSDSRVSTKLEEFVGLTARIYSWNFPPELFAKALEQSLLER